MAYLSPRHQIDVMSDGSIKVDLPIQKYFKVPATGRFIQLKHDYQTYQINNYRPRTAAIKTEVPETIHMNPYETSDFVPLTQKLQEFAFAVMRIPDPAMSLIDAKRGWEDVTMNSVGFTDRHSWDYGDICGDPTKNYADYINGRNLGNKPMAWKILGCGGNICKVIDGNVVEAIDYTKPLPDPVELYNNKPWLFQWATQCYWEIIGTERIDGALRNKYKVSRFPQMGERNVLFPLWGIGGRTRIYESWRIKTIPNGSLYTPYVFQEV